MRIVRTGGAVRSLEILQPGEGTMGPRDETTATPAQHISNQEDSTVGRDAKASPQPVPSLVGPVGQLGLGRRARRRNMGLLVPNGLNLNYDVRLKELLKLKSDDQITFSLKLWSLGANP